MLRCLRHLAMTKMKHVPIFLTEEQRKLLRPLALEQRTSASKLLRETAAGMLENHEDIQEGLKVLAAEKGTISWEQYKKSRRSP